MICDFELQKFVETRNKKIVLWTRIWRSNKIDLKQQRSLMLLHSNEFVNVEDTREVVKLHWIQVIVTLENLDYILTTFELKTSLGFDKMTLVWRRQLKIN